MWRAVAAGALITGTIEFEKTVSDKALKDKISKRLKNYNNLIDEILMSKH